MEKIRPHVHGTTALGALRWYNRPCPPSDYFGERLSIVGSLQWPVRLDAFCPLAFALVAAFCFPFVIDSVGC